MENTRGKGRGGRRGRGTGVVGRRGARGSVRGDTVPAAVGAVERRQIGMPAFLQKLAGPQGTPLTDPQQQEKVLKWMADTASSHISSGQSSTQSTHASQGSGPVHPSVQPPSPQPGPSRETCDTDTFSQELFSGPFPDVLPEEILCPDAQELLQCQGDEGVDIPVASEEVVEDDDETQVSGGEVVREVSQSGDSEEEMGDDEVTDPTWVGQPHEDSASECEATTAPQQVGRGSRLGRGRSRARATTSPTVPRSQAPRQKARYSRVWSFFKEVEGNRRTVVCNLCHTMISRGATTNSLTTTSMIRHMEKKHPIKWIESQSAPDGHTAALPPVSHAGTEILSPGQDPPASSPATSPPTPCPSTASTNVSQRSVQLSLQQTFERKRKYTATHPHARSLNVHICKLLSLEMLPYRLVETEAFRNLMAVAAPRYSVPSRHYFSRCAVPALHRHMSDNVIRALSNALCGKVHLTTDTWTSTGGQGHYISLTAHWVNLVEAGTESHSGPAHVLPTPRIACPTSVTVSTAYYASSSNPPSSSSSTSQLPSVSTSPSVSSSRRSSTAVGKRQQAVLKLLSLGDKRHTAQELLEGIRGETAVWLAPLNLQPGLVVCDNGRNLVAALKLGGLTHVPCMAHVLNLVVQRFLKTYPELSELLTKVRRICAHFRKSTTDAATLRTVQRRLQLPAHRLLCDVPTRWNSTLHMLARVYHHRRAIVDCQLTPSLRPVSHASQLPQVYNEEWTWMAGICQVLSHFEEATQMVSGDAAIITVTIPLLCLLQKALHNTKSEALCMSQELGEDSALLDSQTTLRSVSQRVLEEGEEDEEEETVAHTAEGTHAGSTISVERVWAEEEDLEEEEEEMESQPLEEREVLRCGTVAHMADFMLGCLSRDPRIKNILANSDYWVFTLLDPRYKENFSTLIPEEERTTRVNVYHRALVQKLILSFPSDNPSDRGRSSLGQVTGERRGRGSMSSTGRGTLSQAFASFLAPQPDCVTRPQARQSRAELYRKMVREYVADQTSVLSDHSTPYNYWLSKLDKWPELALYALEVLACPAASVLSERVFSAAGGIITDKRTRLSTDSADSLTFIKMNKAWISPDFSSPPQDSS